MIRLLFTIASALSLLTCIAAVTLLTLNGPQSLHTLYIVGETNFFISGPYLGYQGPPQMSTMWVIQSPQGLFPTATHSGLGPTTILIKLQNIALAAMPMPLAWVFLNKRWPVRASIPRCRKCDYNLTANTSGVCPECGTAVSMKIEMVERSEL